MRRFKVQLTVLACLALAGCAAAMPGYSPPTAKSEKMKAQLPSGGGLAEDGHYVLNEQETKLDCKKINGAIQVAILQLRAPTGKRASEVAVAMHSAAGSTIGGARYGTDPDGAVARSRARVEALNARLAEKGCPTYDIAAELRPGNTDTPMPVKPAKKK